MPKSKPTPQIKPEENLARFRRYISPRQVEEIYGIGRRKLEHMRLANQGPPFRRFGHRSVKYNVIKLERWMEQHAEKGDKV